MTLMPKEGYSEDYTEELYEWYADSVEITLGFGTSIWTWEDED